MRAIKEMQALYAQEVARHEAKHAEEVEHLNTKIAMLVEYTNWADEFVRTFTPNVADYSTRMLSRIPKDWAAARDARVRQEALEEAAAFAESYEPYLSESIRRLARC